MGPEREETVSWSEAAGEEICSPRTVKATKGHTKAPAGGGGVGLLCNVWDLCGGHLV